MAEHEDWKFNINRANEIVRLYGDQTKFFIKLIVSFIVSYNILFVIMSVSLDYITLNRIGFACLVSIYLGYLIVSIYFIINILNSDPTDDTLSSICHFRDNKYFTEDKVYDNIEDFECDLIKSNNFKKDYQITLYNLLKFQKNYSNIAQKGKNLLVANMFIFSASIISSVLVILIFFRS